jgi:hypothetical protein
MRLFDGPPGEGGAQPAAEFAPDQAVMRTGGYFESWSFSEGRSPVMICLYDGSGTYYRARPDPPPTSCSLRNDDGLTLAWCEAP